ncbi:hypothetical protein PIB30_089544 [Stylosanthes scabra]|uniref:Transposase MuDR plant domain-containing protein n=1 Tax=Stylosanthes scabra TaxID=79078 RepID=A0ABU6UTF7_9FABA|nr:hypothetical protein [Stylosanthes scabra]
MAEEDSFLALVHHDGEIKLSSRQGVKFTSKNPTNVFITPRTRLSDFQRNIQRKICSNGRKRLGMIYYRIPISVVAQGVMSQFPMVRTTEMFVEMLAPIAISGGFAPGQHSANVAVQSRPNQRRSSSRPRRLEYIMRRCGLPQALCAPPVQRVPYPGVEEALRADDSNHEPPFIEDDSVYDSGPVPNQQGGASSSGTHQYPPHLSTLNLDALSGPGRVQGEPSSGTQGSQGSNNQAEFQIEQTFIDKEVAILAVKNYSIRRVVEYRVMGSDHAKYLGRCKQFGQGCN